MKTFKFALIAPAAGVVLVLLLPAIPLLPAYSRSACAEDEWKAEFESVCSRTQDSMSFEADELRALVDRCDKLKSRIEQLDETQKKVYLKRLQMCRELFAFVLESRGKK